MLTIERITQLIAKGNQVIATHRPNPSSSIGFPTLDDGMFTAWKTQVLHYLKSNLSSSNPYCVEFEKKVDRGYRSSVESGIGILRSIQEDIELGLFVDNQSKKEINPTEILLNVFNKFHSFTRQLRVRHEDRSTLNISDEYDVQDALHALLRIHFDDIREEEWTPSYAGKSSRMDFLLKDFKIVVEVKKTRKGLGAKEVGTQLIDDIARYKQSQDCETLLCFVYDPEGLIGNPIGIENDLSKDVDGFKVRVYIRP